MSSSTSRGFWESDNIWIFVECKPDYLLVRELGFPRKKIVHAGNISEVCKSLRRSRNSCGLVDEDPYGTRPTYMEELLKTLVLNRNDLKVAYDEKRNNYLIVLRPRLEDWFCKTARILGIDLRKYGIPNDPIGLHAVINENLNKFKRFLKDVLSRKDSRVEDLLRAFSYCKCENF